MCSQPPLVAQSNVYLSIFCLESTYISNFEGLDAIQLQFKMDVIINQRIILGRTNRKMIKRGSSLSNLDVS